MNSITPFFKLVGKTISDHSPSILVGMAVAGTISTAVLSVKATPKAMEIIKEEEPETRFEVVKAVWPCYIPAAVTCSMTIGCIIFSNSISSRRTAAMAGLYSVSEAALSEYRDKVVEVVGEKKAEHIRDEVIKDRVNKNDDHSSIIISSELETVCYDAFNGRYFKSDIESIRRAVNEINHQIIGDGYASLNDFHSKVGLEPTKSGDEVGWNSYKLLEIRFSSHLTSEGRPVLSMEYSPEPKAFFWK